MKEEELICEHCGFSEKTSDLFVNVPRKWIKKQGLDFCSEECFFDFVDDLGREKQQWKHGELDY